MADPLDFTNSDEVMEALTEALGHLCKDVTGYTMVEADETIPKPEGKIILLDLTTLTPFDWETNEVVDEDGIVHIAHNYTATFTLTAYRGKPHWALTRVHQAFGLPYLREKYFPTNSYFAYSSCSNIARIRVPLNQSFYENRARSQVTFNVVFFEKDIGVFEEAERIIITTEASNVSGPPQINDSEIDIHIPPGGNEERPEPCNPPIVYHDNIVDVNIGIPAPAGNLPEEDVVEVFVTGTSSASDNSLSRGQ